MRSITNMRLFTNNYHIVITTMLSTHMLLPASSHSVDFGSLGLKLALFVSICTVHVGLSIHLTFLDQEHLRMLLNKLQDSRPLMKFLKQCCVP